LDALLWMVGGSGVRLGSGRVCAPNVPQVGSSAVGSYATCAPDAGVGREWRRARHRPGLTRARWRACVKTPLLERTTRCLCSPRQLQHFALVKMGDPAGKAPHCSGLGEFDKMISRRFAREDMKPTLDAAIRPRSQFVTLDAVTNGRTQVANSIPAVSGHKL
jgi:hypothetical protein